jgi:hypothetical protein
MAVDRNDVTPPCKAAFRNPLSFGSSHFIIIPATPRHARDVPVMNGKKRVHGKHKTVFMKDDDDDEDEDDVGDLQNSPSSSKRRRVGGLAFAPVSANHKNGRLRSNKASLLEQRRQLPIWKGIFLLYIS